MKNTTAVEFVNKSDIKFDFHYVEYERASDISETCQSSKFLGTILECKEYENYFYILWTYIVLKKKLKSKDSALDVTKILSDFITVMQAFDNPRDPFNKNKVFTKFSKEKIALALSKVKLIQTKLKKSYESNGYPTISYPCFISNKEIRNILIDNLKLMLSETEAYLKNVNINKLDKSFYSVNLETYMKLTHIDDNSSIGLWLRYNLYQATSYFCYSLTASLKDLLDDEVELISALRKSHNYLISCRQYDNYLGIDKASLDDDIYCILLAKYKVQSELIDNIITRLKPTKLTKNDFTHIKEFDYLDTCLKNAIKTKKAGVNILLWGKPGTGKTELAKLLIKSAKAEGYTIGRLQNDRFSGYRVGDIGVIDYKVKELRQILNNNDKAVILFDEAEDFFKDKTIDTKNSLQKNYVNELLENNNTPTIWTTNSLYCFEQSFLRRFTYICEMNDIPRKGYLKIFNNLCKQYNIKKSDKLFNICFENKISVGILSKTFETANLVKDVSEESLILNLKNTYKAQNYGKDLKLLNINRRPKSFDPKLLNTSDNLYEFSEKMKKINRLDFSLLLYGVSGSGKSYYAEYLAQELGLNVIKKKASDLESMWVGETEKNIAKAFAEALEEKAVLIIDEGDHFISERSKHNQTWETSRTEEMLQQIENHPYPVIFTTNLIDNIDKAAMRRFTYKTQFDYLTKEQVKLAWKDYFPKAKLPNDIHLSKLCPGDFATVYKKAEFEDYLTNTSLIYQKLEEEQNIKKEMEYSSIKL